MTQPDPSAQTVQAQSPMLRFIPPEIRGQRVILRAYSHEDGPSLWAAVNDSRHHLSPWQGWTNQMNSPQDAELSVRKAQSDWHLRTRMAWIITVASRFAGH